MNAELKSAVEAYKKARDEYQAVLVLDTDIKKVVLAQLRRREHNAGRLIYKIKNIFKLSGSGEVAFRERVEAEYKKRNIPYWRKYGPYSRRMEPVEDYEARVFTAENNLIKLFLGDLCAPDAAAFLFDLLHDAGPEARETITAILINITEE